MNHLPTIDRSGLTVDMTVDAATLARDCVRDKLASLKNHIASAVEEGNAPYVNTDLTGFDYAAKLVIELRRYEEAFKHLNGALLRKDGTI